jgi:2,3-bisphosphoglycerate-independent phosphoglycerate mutase
MKVVIAIGDGMADEIRDDLGKKSPVEYAKTPNMDQIAKEGICRYAQTVPIGMAPGSDVANMSILGYAPEKYHTGRSPIEAASLGVKIADDEMAFRCNLVNVKDGLMNDYSAGHIEDDDASEVIEALKALNCDQYQFHTGCSYRHLLVVKMSRSDDFVAVPPHDISDKEILPYMPSGGGSDLINEIMTKAREVLATAEINKKRVSAGKLAVTDIWPWGEGTAPTYPSLKERYNLSGAVISAVDLVKGLGHLAKMEVIEVEGATGYLGTNYAGKVEACREALRKHDVIYLHIEAPDETSHEGDLQKKLQAIEEFDEQVVGEVIKMRDEFEGLRIITMPDHPTFVSTKTHDAGPVPFAISGEGVVADDSTTYCEKSAAKSPVKPISGVDLFDAMVKGTF